MGIEQRITRALNREVTRRRLLDIAVFGAADIALGMAARDGIKAVKAGNSADNAETAARLFGQEEIINNPMTYRHVVGPGFSIPVINKPIPEATPTPITPAKQSEIKRGRENLLYEAEIQKEKYYKHIVLGSIWTSLGLLIGGHRYFRKDT